MRPRAMQEHAVVTVAAQGACHGGERGGGHAHHADPVCASSAISGGFRLPPPALSGSETPAADRAVWRQVPSAPQEARGPPDLTVLQVLRT
ncbi:DUF6153 family protein [Streptomyces longispororuber]|nr:DUF6153 family protein [Streptomyces longispororuber]